MEMLAARQCLTFDENGDPAFHIPGKKFPIPVDGRVYHDAQDASSEGKKCLRTPFVVSFDLGFSILSDFRDCPEVWKK